MFNQNPSFILTQELVQQALDGRDLSVLQDWMAALEHLLAQAPDWFAIRDQDKMVFIKHKGKVYWSLEHLQTPYYERELFEFNAAFWSKGTWRGAIAEQCRDMLKHPQCVQLQAAIEVLTA